ncbi:MAG TPA: hypothetical protein VLE48_12750 [Terriglobales bacterium]|nr:hypothetical protein [Terriglobales bacterium]
MPIDYRIDGERRLVIATGRGTVTHEDLRNYQSAVWSNPEVAGFNELADMRAVEHFGPASPEQMLELASLAARMDAGGAATKFAMVAPHNVAYGLGRMFQAYRGMERESRKRVGVFRTMEEALKWLGVEEVSQ